MSQAIALCVQIRSPNVPTPSGFSVQAGSQDSVVQLKQLIQQEHPRRPPYRQMRLFYQGRELLDGDTLDQYIRDADAPVTVHMFVAAWVPPPSPLPQPSTEKVPPAVADPARGMLPPPRLGQDQQQKQSTPKTNGEYDAVPRGQAQLTHASNSSPQFHRHDSREIKGGQDIPAAQRPDHLPRQPPAVSIISLGHAFQYVLIK
ncbi:hypothetical protein EV182_000149 [Spiromyces aspiralis]|uniref:Uncharacterized protein n=1 Tax=Spiromyces aspiralis TaxID=68401 RepID=A0ACC1HYM7_9FUNG|nr:hypothetical protein EV182_000149 [Spiromyces aspiralis]